MIMERVKEKANDYARTRLCRTCDKCIDPRCFGCYNEAKQSFIVGYTEANKWISVEEELPPCSYKDILVKGYDIDGNVSYGIAYMHDTNTGIPDKNNFIVSEYINIVTHWRPIN